MNYLELKTKELQSLEKEFADNKRMNEAIEKELNEEIRMVKKQIIHLIYFKNKIKNK